MTDNTQLNLGLGGSLMRTISKTVNATSVQTSVAVIDLGGSGAENLLTGAMPVTATQLPAELGQAPMSASLPVVIATNQTDIAVQQDAQKAAITTLQNAATANGNGTVANLTGYNGLLNLSINNGAGTCTVTIQGSIDNFATSQSAQNVTVLLLSSNAAGTPTATTLRTLTNGVLSISPNTNYFYQINDKYPYCRAVISSATGLGPGTYVTGLSIVLYALPI